MCGVCKHVHVRGVRACMCVHLYDACMLFVLYAHVYVLVCGMCANMWHMFVVCVCASV